ncbi:CheY-like chemotaxis protein [Paraburkholderia sp. WSM4179]|nr:CheY-like chemotaxis protein [Paraburkholderia sp. WSM4179]
MNYAQAVSIVLIEDDDGHATLVERNLANFVVLLDLKMPRVDGFEVLRRLKEAPETAAVPVIVLTTTDEPREIARCYELGCNVYICKPVEYDAFIEAVRLSAFSCKWSNCRRGIGSRRPEAVRKPFMTR